MPARGNHLISRSIGLVLTLALLLVGVPFTEQVLAAPGDAGFTTSPSISGGVLHIPLSIVPLTGTDGSISLTVHFRRGGVDIATGTSAVPTIVYNNLLTLSEVVYSGLPSGFGTSGVQRGSGSTVTVTGSNVVNIEVYIDEVSGGGTPPGGGGGTTPGGGTTTSGTSTGWQKYDSATNTSTVYVDPEKTQGLYSNAPATGVVLVTAPTGAQTGTVPQNVTASLPLDVVKQGSGATVSSVLNMGPIDMALPPSVMQALAQSVRDSAGGLGSLRVDVKTATDQGTRDMLSGLKDVDLTDLKPASQVITVSFVAVDAQGKETKLTVDKTKVTVGFNPQAVSDPAKVNLYIIGSLIYVGGKVDPVTHKVTADISKTQGGKFVALEYDKTFSDITTHWAKSDIELLASKYVVKGMTDTEFWPGSPVTRAHFVTLLVRALGLAEEAPKAPTFKDVAAGTWYYGYIEAAFKAGLALGDGGKGGNFRPTETISREEMSVLLIRALKVNGTSAAPVAASDVAGLLRQFVDGSSISDWAKSEVAQAVNAGLIKGRPGGVVDPKGQGTRAEAATMVSRLMKQAGIL